MFLFVFVLVFVLVMRVPDRVVGAGCDGPRSADGYSNYIIALLFLTKNDGQGVLGNSKQHKGGRWWWWCVCICVCGGGRLCMCNTICTAVLDVKEDETTGIDILILIVVIVVVVVVVVVAIRALLFLPLNTCTHTQSLRLSSIYVRVQYCIYDGKTGRWPT